ncbi:hypothetical protein [Nitrobacter sp.]|uniref:hypothetical protein n=1 Tax=Nitrobacter sp. TaxID=29420 RepID=UPI00399D78C3
MDSLGKFVQALYRVATLYTLQSGQPVFDSTHHAKRNLVVRKPLENLQLVKKQFRSILDDLRVPHSIIPSDQFASRFRTQTWQNNSDRVDE